MEGMKGRVQTLGNGVLCVPIARPAMVQLERGRAKDYEDISEDTGIVVEVTGKNV